MTKSPMATIEEALAMLKEKNRDTAYAGMVGYLMAFVDQKTADTILQLVKDRK